MIRLATRRSASGHVAFRQIGSRRFVLLALALLSAGPLPAAAIAPQQLAHPPVNALPDRPGVAVPWPAQWVARPHFRPAANGWQSERRGQPQPPGSWQQPNPSAGNWQPNPPGSWQPYPPNNRQPNPPGSWQTHPPGYWQPPPPGYPHRPPHAYPPIQQPPRFDPGPGGFADPPRTYPTPPRHYPSPQRPWPPSGGSGPPR